MAVLQTQPVDISFWNDLRLAIREHPWKLVGWWLLILGMSMGDNLEVIPALSPGLVSPAFHFFHQNHHLLAIAIAMYVGYRYGAAAAALGMLGFLAAHSYYFYLLALKELPETSAIVISVSAAILGAFLMQSLRHMRNRLGYALEKERDDLNRLEGLHGVSMEASQAQDINTLLQKALPFIMKVTGMELASFHGFQAQTDQLILLSQRGWTLEQSRRMSIFPRSGVLGEALHSGKIVTKDQASADSSPVSCLMIEAGVRGFIAVPLISGSSSVGVLMLATKIEKSISDEVLMWLETLGHEMGLHLNRLLLFQELERQKKAAQGLARKMEEDLTRYSQVVQQTARLLAVAVEAHYPYLQGHQSRVLKMVVPLGQSTGLSEKDIASLELAARIHDIGLARVPHQETEGLDPLKTSLGESLKLHPVFAVDWLEPFGELFQPALPAIRTHHERWDGSGYPDGLAGTAIPETGRLLAVVDTYDFLRANFPDRPALTHQEALQKITLLSGSALDPKMVAGFLSIFAGSLIAI